LQEPDRAQDVQGELQELAIGSMAVFTGKPERLGIDERSESARRPLRKTNLAGVGEGIRPAPLSLRELAHQWDDVLLLRELLTSSEFGGDVM